MEDQYTKVLEIQLNYEKAIQGIAEYERQIQSAKHQQEEWRKDLKALERNFDDGKISADEYAESQKLITEQLAASKIATTQLKKEQAVLTKQLQQEVKAENAQQDSLVQLRARLSNLTAEYDALSGEMRKGDVGKALQDQINAVTDEIKGAEEDTQRYYRNVGNYANSVREAFASMNKSLEETKKQYEEVVAAEGAASEAAQDLKTKMEAQQAVMDKTGQYILNLQSSIIPFGDKIIPLLGKGMKGVKEAFTLASEGAKILGKQFLALMANPIVAFLALLAASIAVVVKGIASSEENMNKWNLIMAPLKRGLAALQSVLQTLCGWILNIVAVGEGLISFFLKLAENLPIVGDAFKSVNEEIEASIQLEKEKIAIEKQERANTVQNAKDALEVAKLRSEAQDKEHKTAEERLAANQKAQKILEEQADREVDLAERKLQALQLESEWADNDAETNRKLAEAEAEVYKARERQFNLTRELMSQQNTLRQEIERDSKAEIEAKKQANQKAVETAKDRASKELEAIRQAEDAMLALIKDANEKNRRQIELSYSREIEDLKNKLATEKNLTETAREAINQTIQAKEQQMANELADLQAQISQDEISKLQEKIQLKLEAVKQGTEEEYKLMRESLDLQMQADLAKTEQEIQNIEEREEMKALILAKYSAQQEQLEQQIEEEKHQRKMDAIQQQYEQQIAAAGENEQTLFEAELDQIQAQRDAINELQNISEEERIKQLDMLLTKEDQVRKKHADAQIKMEQTKDKAIASIMGTLSDAIQDLSGDNKEAANIAKMVGLAELYINQAVAISEAIKSASQGDPYTAAARIAAAVASVVVGMVSAFSSMSQAKFAKGGKVDAAEIYHANGGKIRGAGTGTSDSIPAMLSNGEFVMTAAATRLFEPILTQMNDIGSGVTPQLAAPFSMTLASPDLLSESLAASVAEIHPVVSVVDINEGQSRVDLIDSLDTI